MGGCVQTFDTQHIQSDICILTSHNLVSSCHFPLFLIFSILLYSVLYCTVIHYSTVLHLQHLVIESRGQITAAIRGGLRWTPRGNLSMWYEPLKKRNHQKPWMLRTHENDFIYIIAIIVVWFPRDRCAKGFHKSVIQTNPRSFHVSRKKGFDQQLAKISDPL